MTIPPAPDPHPLAGAWPPIETTVFEFWGLARPAMNALAEERGIPLALHNYAELGLEALSVAEALRRDPYSRPEDFAEEFARLAAAGWLDAIGGSDDPMITRYVVLPHAREAVGQVDAAGDALLADLVAVPDEELARIDELLAAIHAANLAAPEPPARWGAERRFRSAHASTPLPGRIREAALDLLAYRDDVHLAAWSAHADPASEGGMWNAFSHVWSGAASTAEGIALAAAFRGYDASFYEQALGDLEARGWLVADGVEYRTTAAGQELRDEVERQTDEWFFAPWAVLGEEGITDLRQRVEALLRSLPLL
ncbi:MAG: hypothetical protein OXG95_05425 [Chloroflexi bacterium]|nr:hypothetical protein [Chloroflexota bacterium]